MPMNARGFGSVALIACVAIGAVAVAALATQSGTRPAEASFQIPFARIGDEVEYAHRWEQGRGDDGTPVNRTGEYRTATRVRELGQAPDSSLAVHAVIILDHHGTFPEVDRISGAFGEWFTTEWVDLETRSLAQTQSWWSGEAFAASDVEWGPLSEDPYWYAHRDIGQLYGAGGNFTHLVQGRTFRVGQDVTSLELSGFFLAALEKRAPWNFFPFRVDRPESFRFRAWVDAQGELGGREVYSIVREVVLDYHRTTLRDLPVRERTWHEVQRTTFWYDPEIPWPVRIEREYSRDEIPNVTRRSSLSGDVVRDYSVISELVRYVPGTQPIPWGWSNAAGTFRSENPAAERAGPDELYPAGGADSRFLYPLRAAIQNVRTDPTLVDLRAWESRHADRELVGITLTPRPPPMTTGILSLTPSQPVATWTFVFASPSANGSAEQAFVVTSTRGATGQPFNRDWGSDCLPPRAQFTREDLPRNSITFEHADRVWHALAPAHVTSRNPYSISWGYSGTMSHSRDPQDRDGFDVAVTLIPNGLKEISFFDLDARPSENPNPPENVATLQISQLRIRVPSGNAEWGLYYDHFQGRYVLGNPAAHVLLGPPKVVAANDAKGQEGNVGMGVVAAASASLFAALVAYFLPLLKFLSTRWIVTFPGYAKLARSELLGNRFRERIVQLVQQEPGITPPELHRRVGGGWTTIVYHLRVLERNKILSSLVQGRHKRFFHVEAVPWTERDRVGILRQANTKTVYDSIIREPGLMQSELAHRHQLTPAGARWHLQRLERAGLVDSTRAGSRILYYPARTRPEPLAGVETS